MKEKQEKIENTAGAEAERRENKTWFIVTLVTSVLLGLLFIMDLVFFIIGAIKWYIFLILLAIYAIVFPAAIFMMSRFKKSVRQAEADAEKAATKQLREEIVTDIENGTIFNEPVKKSEPEKEPDSLDQYDE